MTGPIVEKDVEHDSIYWLPCPLFVSWIKVVQAPSLHMTAVSGYFRCKAGVNLLKSHFLVHVIVAGTNLLFTGKFFFLSNSV